MSYLKILRRRSTIKSEIQFYQQMIDRSLLRDNPVDQHYIGHCQEQQALYRIELEELTIPKPRTRPEIKGIVISNGTITTE